LYEVSGREAEIEGKPEEKRGRKYLLPYSAEGKTLIKVGVEFDREKRTIGKWVEKTADSR
jgi:hypothetical protein